MSIVCSDFFVEKKKSFFVKLYDGIFMEYMAENRGKDEKRLAEEKRMGAARGVRRRKEREAF